MSNRFKYNRRGRIETGFDNSIDHKLFGHPKNPEYQELCQYERKRMQERDCKRQERPTVDLDEDELKST